MWLRTGGLESCLRRVGFECELLSDPDAPSPGLTAVPRSARQRSISPGWLPLRAGVARGAARPALLFVMCSPSAGSLRTRAAPLPLVWRRSARAASASPRRAHTD